MFKCVPTDGLEFYKILYEDNNFCRELGKVVLIAGELESEIKQYIKSTSKDEKTKKATLGRLIKVAKKGGLSSNILQALEIVRDQRNYLMHNVHALFSGLIEETILERSGLLDSDVDLFTERASQLKENLKHLADIIHKNALS